MKNYRTQKNEDNFTLNILMRMSAMTTAIKTRKAYSDFSLFKYNKTMKFEIKGGALSSTHPIVTHFCRLYGRQ